MTLINNDQLTTIFMADPDFTKMTEALEENHKELAHDLAQLGQDAGHQWEGDKSNYDPQAGELTASIAKNYEPVTTDRLNNILQRVHAALSNSQLQTKLTTLMQTLETQASPLESVEPSSAVPRNGARPF
jgi:hypothetical protein